jgi:hypothetical protein
MKKQNLLLGAIAIALITTWYSCNKKEQSPVINVSNEVITTLRIKAVNIVDPTDTPSAQWVQLDRSGATAPDTSKFTLNLRKNASYKVQLRILDTLTDITDEILSRQNYHLYCFYPAAGLNLITTLTDHDTNTPSLPIGLQDNFATGAASTGGLEINMRHQPNVKDGTCGPGSSDLDAFYNIKIQ